MPMMTSYPAGTFCWADLATTDPNAAFAFYREIFRWTAENTPTDQGIPYSMLSRDGKRVGAIYRVAPQQGPVPYWSSYVCVADVDLSAEQAATLGGSVLMPPTDVMDQGRLCFVQDPAGAVLGLWQPRLHFGAELEGAPGARCWSELQTKDTAAAAAFYRGLLGWTARESTKLMAVRYWLFELDGREVGGMLEIQDDWGPVPPNWAVYFGVERCDDAVAAAERLGGTVVAAPMEIAGVGRFAFLLDPQGATFAVIQSDR